MKKRHKQEKKNAENECRNEEELKKYNKKLKKKKNQNSKSKTFKNVKDDENRNIFYSWANIGALGENYSYNH